MHSQSPGVWDSICAIHALILRQMAHFRIGIENNDYSPQEAVLCCITPPVVLPYGRACIFRRY